MDSMNFHNIKKVNITRGLLDVYGRDLYIIKIISENEEGFRNEITLFSSERVVIDIESDRVEIEIKE